MDDFLTESSLCPPAAGDNHHNLYHSASNRGGVMIPGDHCKIPETVCKYRCYP